MTVETVLNIASEALWTIIVTSGPMLIISLVIGLVVSIIQTITSIQEQTLTFIPKLFGIFICLMLFGNFIMDKIVSFMQNLWAFEGYIK